MPKKIAFITYETPFAPCGGIAAVIGRIPGYMQKTSGLETVVITPYHHNIAKTASLRTTHAGSVSIPFGKRTMNVNILRSDHSWPMYFIDVQDKRVFSGVRHPYDVGRSQDEITSNLLRDSLIFGVAVAKSLDVIGPGTDWVLMMQDWEAATAALALAGKDGRHKLFLTLHNSYDSGAVSEDSLRQVGIDPRLCHGPAGSTRATVLERALPIISTPIFTVSEQFALDLTEDVFQGKVMAPHLGSMLTSQLRGVDNGPFSDLALDDAVLSDAAKGHTRRLQAWKQEKREEALLALDRHIPSSEQPVWGDIARFKRDDTPWFVMAGRDDPRQKGYDVAAVAVSRYLEDGGNARFFFFTIPGDEGLDGLGFLKRVAERYPESVLVLPFIFQAGYFATLSGASFGIMPSLYEPFGMANEFYLKGTAGIGRATGGIIQQIVPLRDASAFSMAVGSRSDRWHSPFDPPTGILYRERDDISSAIYDWSHINGAGYKRNGGWPDRVQERLKYPLFQNMAAELHLALIDGARIFRYAPDLYYKMIVEGVKHIQNTFSWDRAAAEYVGGMGMI